MSNNDDEVSPQAITDPSLGEILQAGGHGIYQGVKYLPSITILDLPASSAFAFSDSLLSLFPCVCACVCVCVCVCVYVYVCVRVHFKTSIKSCDY